MSQNQKINSLVDLGTPASVPEEFTDPQVRAAVELTINGQQNLLRIIEQYLGITQKDITLWANFVASDTLLRHEQGRFYVTASENIAFNELVNIHNVAGVANVRRANATAGTVRPARGYCNSVTSADSGIQTGEKGEVILSQGLIALGGIVAGDAIYLSTTAGGYSTVAPVGVGQLEQFVGVGVGTNIAYIDISLGSYIQH